MFSAAKVQRTCVRARCQREGGCKVRETKWVTRSDFGGEESQTYGFSRAGLRRPTDGPINPRVFELTVIPGSGKASLVIVPDVQTGKKAVDVSCGSGVYVVVRLENFQKEL